MRKSLWIVLLLALVCTLALSACDDTNQPQTPDEDHVHAFGEWTTVKDATCTVKGEQERICSCGEKETKSIDAILHTEAKIDAIPATCTKAGTTEGKKCSVCDVVLVAPQTVQPVAHTEEKINAVPATCTKAGTTEGKKCSVCDVVLVAPQTVQPVAHTEEKINAVPATCTTAGTTEGKKCSVCDVVLVAPQTVQPVAHTEEKINAVPATCTKAGTTEGKKCSVCDVVLVAPQTVQPIAHTEEKINAVPATCTTAGTTEGKKCSVCDVVLVAPQTVQPVAHTEEKINAVPATCTTAGTTKGKKCSVCDVVLVAPQTVQPVAHTEEKIDAVPATCTSIGLTEGKRCSICKTITVEQTIIDNFGHKYDYELDAICNTCGEERVVDKILLSISTNDVFGYVRGLENLRRSATQNDASVILYNATNSYITQLGPNNEYFFKEVPAGKYYLKIEIAGYQVPEPIEIQVGQNGNILQHIEVSQMIGDDFYYHWRADKTYFGYEESATVPSEKTFTFLDEVVAVNDSNATAKLQRHYKMILSNEELNWSSDYASRILDLVEGIYEFPRNIPSKWILTFDEIDDDVEITYETESTVIRISKSAFENATPRKAEYNGLKGTYFSNRLYHALIRYATKEGTDINYIDRILQHDYGCSIIVEDYAALTAGITNETNAAFEMFKPEELLAILEMFAEMPQGFHRIENLEYLVRRIDGVPNPIYPDAAAVSWIYAEHGYIEFMDKAFLGSEVEDTFRLVLHEKSHFLWTHVFSDELKAKWIEIGGWYETTNDADRWSTTKETEFVTAYAHAHNPDEDMAESIAYYILMPDKLESRSPAKYAFIRDYIMNGEIYITQIREDLTFEVYNLYPDYNYPGKIVGIDIQVSGAPEEDKKVTVTVTLDTNGDSSFGANCAVMRVFSDADTYYDLWVIAIDESMSILRGTITISKYAYNGFWHNEEIELRDIDGNQRFVGVDNFGWKLYINNPLADLEAPQYVQDSVRVEVRPGEFQGKPVTYVDVIFKATDNIGLDTVYCSIANNTYNSYRMDEYGTYNKETGEAVITYIFTEYMQSGEYSVNYIMLKDYAENKSMFYFYSDGTGTGYPATFVFNSDNSDYEAPVLDVNRITITATPTHPENPNGETVVHIEYWVKDNASGLGVVSYRLLDPLGNTHFEYHYHENFYTTFFEGDPITWTKYEINVILPEGSAPGKWGLLEIYVSDKAGNFITYNFLEILHFQVASK